MEEKYLILLQMVSAGQNGLDLGCDEEQIVYLLYAILDVHRNKVWNLEKCLKSLKSLKSLL